MATVEECRAALEKLVGQLESAGGSAGAGLSRSVSCFVPDLDVTFFAALGNGRLGKITTRPGERAQVRLTAPSDDLVALADGRLDLTAAWSAGRVKVEASFLDLLKLRSLL